MRYGHQPRSEIMSWTLDEVYEAAEDLSAIVAAENGQKSEGDDADLG